MIPALAFEKKEQIEKSFELIVEEITNVADQQNLDSFVIEKIDKLCLYFQTNYIKCPLLSRPATFPHKYGIKETQPLRELPEQPMLLRAGIIGYKPYSADPIPELGNF